MFSSSDVNIQQPANILTLNLHSLSRVLDLYGYLWDNILRYNSVLSNNGIVTFELLSLLLSPVRLQVWEIVNSTFHPG